MSAAAFTFTRSLLDRLRARGAESVAALAAAAGHAIRHARTVSAFLPGLAGAGMASWGTALIYRPAGIILGGLFLLAMDRQINVR